MLIKKEQKTEIYVDSFSKNVNDEVQFVKNITITIGPGKNGRPAMSGLCCFIKITAFKLKPISSKHF